VVVTCSYSRHYVVRRAYHFIFLSRIVFFSVSTVLLCICLNNSTCSFLCIFMILFRSFPFKAIWVHSRFFFYPNRTPPSLISLNRVFFCLFLYTFQLLMSDLLTRTPNPLVTLTRNGCHMLNYVNKFEHPFFYLNLLTSCCCYQVGC
jgi:hypothetical protein